MRRAVVIDNDAPVAGQARLTRELILGLGADADKRVVGGEAASIAGEYLFEPVVAREAGHACSPLAPSAEFRQHAALPGAAAAAPHTHQQLLGGFPNRKPPATLSTRPPTSPATQPPPRPNH